MPMALAFPGETNDIAPRSAQLALKRLDLLRRQVEMLFKQFFQYVHEFAFQRFRFQPSWNLT